MKKPKPLPEEQIRTNPPRIMSLSEASTYMGISNGLLRKMIAEKKVRACKLSHLIKLRLQDVDAAVERSIETTRF
jgi:excisionase family DNA binding protein